MTRRTEWQLGVTEPEDSGGLDPSRAGERPPRTSRSARSSHDSFGRRSRRERPERAEEQDSRDPVERARAICLRLLTGTSRTRQQLADALREREVPDEAAEELLSRFEAVGLIDDAAFADAWVDSRHRSRGLARGALARELRTKGVESEVIAEAVGRLDAEQEERTARELVDRKLSATRGVDPAKRIRRLVGMLARKGYGQGVAMRVVRQALEEEGEQAELLEEHLPDS